MRTRFAVGEWVSPVSSRDNADASKSVGGDDFLPSCETRPSPTSRGRPTSRGCPTSRGRPASRGRPRSRGRPTASACVPPPLCMRATAASVCKSERGPSLIHSNSNVLPGGDSPQRARSYRRVSTVSIGDDSPQRARSYRRVCTVSRGDDSPQRARSYRMHARHLQRACNAHVPCTQGGRVQTIDANDGCRRWMQTMDADDECRRWMQTMNAGDGCRRWVQTMDANDGCKR